jgi:poly-gamma-glutamate synthesis protein (capsule biosynthesis protein)
VWNPGDFATHEAARHVAWADPEPLLGAVVRARAEHDIVLVSYHGGREYSEFPAREPVEIARLAMDAGADAVIAHHPHVLQGIGWDGPRPIFYSLGNLVFGKHRDHPWTARGFLARLTFSGSGLDVGLCPYLIHRETPRRVTRAPGNLDAFTRHVRRTSSFASLAGTETGSIDESGCFPVRPGRG